MVLPTNGRVIIDTTVGEIDIELWSKVGYKNIQNVMTFFFLKTRLTTGNTKNMSQLPRIGNGGFVSFAQNLF